MLLEADLPSDPQALRDRLAATMAELAVLRATEEERQAQIADRAAARAEIVRLNAVNDHAEAELVRLHVIGEDIAERLDVVPATFRVLVTRRPRYGCRGCEAAPDLAPVSPDGLKRLQNPVRDARAANAF